MVITFVLTNGESHNRWDVRVRSLRIVYPSTIREIVGFFASHVSTI
jgi:hypothetical protein